MCVRAATNKARGNDLLRTINSGFRKFSHIEMKNITSK